MRTILIAVLMLALFGCASQDVIGTKPVEVPTVVTENVVLKVKCVKDADIPLPPENIDSAAVRKMPPQVAVKVAFGNAGDWVAYASTLRAMLQACVE